MTLLSDRTEIATRLIDVEAALRQLRLWQEEAPAAEALASVQPFAIDTLAFPQWLQFIFLPTMHGIIAQQRPMPETCAIAPMAEQSFSEQPLPVSGLIAILAELDTLITDTD